MNQFAERHDEEIQKRTNVGNIKNIIKPHRIQHASLIGGSTLTPLPTFKEMMINIQEYNESGSEIIRKCP